MRPSGLSPRPSQSRAAGLTRRSDLRGIVLRMISLNSLAAFTAEVSRLQAPAQARAASSTPAATAPEAPRRLDALPPQPSSPLPRGSLLDLRV